ncbi:hypothetical protein GMMP1_240044 [Candidatus Magnetomoraceae bacterium gMMP-1]
MNIKILKIKKTLKIIDVMGGGQASLCDIETAYQLGSLIAREGWILLNGGRTAGIMEAFLCKNT